MELQQHKREQVMSLTGDIEDGRKYNSPQRANGIEREGDISSDSDTYDEDYWYSIARSWKQLEHDEETDNEGKVIRMSSGGPGDVFFTVKMTDAPFKHGNRSTSRKRKKGTRGRKRKAGCSNRKRPRQEWAKETCKPGIQDLREVLNEQRREQVSQVSNSTYQPEIPKPETDSFYPDELVHPTSIVVTFNPNEEARSTGDGRIVLMLDHKQHMLANDINSNLSHDTESKVSVADDKHHNGNSYFTKHKDFKSSRKRKKPLEERSDDSEAICTHRRKQPRLYLLQSVSRTEDKFKPERQDLRKILNQSKRNRISAKPHGVVLPGTVKSESKVYHHRDQTGAEIGSDLNEEEDQAKEERSALIDKGSTHIVPNQTLPCLGQDAEHETSPAEDLQPEEQNFSSKDVRLRKWEGYKDEIVQEALGQTKKFQSHFLEGVIGSQSRKRGVDALDINEYSLTLRSHVKMKCTPSEVTGGYCDRLRENIDIFDHSLWFDVHDDSSEPADEPHYSLPQHDKELPAASESHPGSVIRSEICIASQKAKSTHSRHQISQGTCIPGPSSYSIMPTSFDLEVDAVLQPAILKGPYKDVGHYLDVQFHLLRQDFINPLRRGILELKRHPGNESFDHSDVRFYHGVTVLGIVSIGSDIGHLLQFDVSKVKHIQWETGKRLMTGSLICMSNDNFSTVFFGTVAKSETRGLKIGQVVVTFEKETDSQPFLGHLSNTDSFVMGESVAYYESYRHVLQVLQILMMSKKKLPLGYHIVKCITTMKTPQYLKFTHYEYDIVPLMKPGEKDKTITRILEPQDWPPRDCLCLNSSQVDAVRLALTSTLALIQGPPGTGKTFVGLKLVEVLLTKIRRICKPILVVCRTNHALDQFLEKILKFCRNGIRRIGGKYNTGPLQHCRLDIVGQSKPLRALRKKLETTTEKMRCLTDKAKLLMYEVMDTQDAQRLMKDSHYESLTSRSNPKSTCSLHRWLGVPKGSSTFEEVKIIIGVILVSVIQNFRSAERRELLFPMNNSDNTNTANLFYRLLDQMPNPKDSNTSLKIQLALKEMMDLKWVTRRPILTNKLTVEELHTILDGIQLLKCILDDKDENDSKLRKYDEGKGHENKTPRPKRKIIMKRGMAMLIRRTKLLSLSKDILGPQGHNKSPMSQFSMWLRKTKHMSSVREEQIDDVWLLKPLERYALYMTWLKRHKEILKTDLQQKYKEIAELQCMLHAAKVKRHVEVLKKANVIGATTTGAYKNHDILREVGARIIVVEEAADVLEAHIVTALNQKCEHLILIGDHQQLRPRPADYNLGKHYGLHISLFERLVMNNFTHVVLTEQHRMRPEISMLMRHIYPKLEDHHSVTEYEDIRGIDENVYFIDHIKTESGLEGTMSKANEFEATYLAGLYRYLLQQNYTPDDITVLATYTGQVECIKEKFRQLLNTKQSQRSSEPKVVTVDNFQGEESDIVLLSLVRSNEENNAGFLKTSNRVCVALSRAKKGMYVIGDFRLLTLTSELWKKIVKSAKDNNMFGPGIPIVCHRHPEAGECIVYTGNGFDEGHLKCGCGSRY